MTEVAQQNYDASAVLNYFVDLVATAITKKMQTQTPMPQPLVPIAGREVIHGIRGIAAFLHVSTATAQKIRNKHLFPVYFTGSKLFTFSDEVISALKSKGDN